MTGRKYLTSTAMRAALEQRLRERHNSSGLPLDRLRKETALQRLLARIVAAAPADSWALKGGMAMIARVSYRARATADADATWRGTQSELRDMLDRASELDLNDSFEFVIGRARKIQGEGPEGGLRYLVVARLASRIFENLRIDVNIIPDDPRPIEEIELRNLLDFADIPAVIVPAIYPQQQLAEKLHAYTRSYGQQENGRAKDLYDMLIIAQELSLPTLTELAAACRQTFSMRETIWPPALGPPPAAWAAAWQGFVDDYQIQFVDLDSSYHALASFWLPVFAEKEPAATWHAATWTWA